MSPRPVASVLLLAAVLLAGCSGGGGDGGIDQLAEEAPELEVTSTTGGIRGVVVDEAVRPVAGAQVKVLNTDKEATSDENGLFTVSGLEPGTYVVTATHALYDLIQQTVEVVAGVADPPAVKFQLSRVIFSEPYLQTLKFDGFIVCSANVVTPAGGLLSEECGEGVGVPCEVPVVGCQRAGGQGNNAAQFDFTVGNGTQSIVVEQVWTPTSEAGTGFYSPVSTEWSCLPVCSGNTLIELQGPSPLRGVIDRAMMEDNDIVEDSTVISVFTWADPGNQALPASVLLNQQYQTFVTTFHYLPAPEAWSFVNGDSNPF